MFTLGAKKRPLARVQSRWDPVGGRGQGREIILLDVESPKESLTLLKHEIDLKYTVDKGHSGVAFHPDGSRLASIGDNGTIKIWAPAVRRDSLTLDTSTRLTSVAFSPDGQRVAATGEDGLIHIWDASDGRQLPWLTGPSPWVEGVAFSPDGSRIAAACGETVTIWESTDRTRMRVLTSRKGDQLASVAFSPSGRQIAAAGLSGRLVSWDLATGRRLSVSTAAGTFLMKPLAGVITAFSPDGSRIASGNTLSRVTIRDAVDGREIIRIEGGDVVAYRPDGLWIATTAADYYDKRKDAGMVTLWDAASGKTRLVLRGHTGAVNCVAFSPDGSRLASAGADALVRVWDTMTGQETLALRGHTKAIRGIAFSSDGTRIASCSDDGTVRIWEARPPSLEVNERREALRLLLGTARAVATRPSRKADQRRHPGWPGVVIGFETISRASGNTDGSGG